jgi:hypothetical protein
MFNKNIRMTVELRNALNLAAKNCNRSQSSAVRCCLKYADRLTGQGVSIVGLSKKSKYPTNSGEVFVSIEIPERYQELSNELIRCSIAVKLMTIKPPSAVDAEWIEARRMSRLRIFAK